MTRPIGIIFAIGASALVLASCASRGPKAAPAQPQPPPMTSEAPSSQASPAQAGAAFAPGSQEELASTIGDRVFFATDSFDLDQDARATLSRQAQWLIRHDRVQALIAGNADERGTREYNLALGARRAAAARQFLITQGVAANRLSTVSYGKERPLDPASGEAAWARNRNAHTIVTEGRR